jgi:hypothetical protein
MKPEISFRISHIIWLCIAALSLDFGLAYLLVQLVRTR